METIDAILLDRLRDGDARAFTALFERYWKLLYNSAYQRLGDEAIAKDIVQEVFMQVWDKREKLVVAAEYMEYYLLKSIKNRVINHYTSLRVKEAALSNMMLRMEELSTQEYQPSQYLEMERFLDQQVDKLPDTMKAVFLLRSDHNSITTISQKLSIAEQTVKNNLTEASHRLRKSLRKRFSEEEFAGLIIILGSLLST